MDKIIMIKIAKKAYLSINENEIQNDLIKINNILNLTKDIFIINTDHIHSINKRFFIKY